VNRQTLAVLALLVALRPMHATEETPLRISVNGRVVTLQLDDYVAQVVAGEGQPKAAEGAQQALAITARTYALANRHRHRREGYDLCDTTHCQVLRPATDAARRAAHVTAGRVLLHQGQPASVYYSALCGGHSELASRVWPGADDTSSHLHQDDACRDEPRWSSELTVSEIERALRAAGLRGDRLRELRVLERNNSGRVMRLRAAGFTPSEVSGHDLRMALSRISQGKQALRSTAFDVRRTGSGYRFTGTGYGHGVGLCVIGAGRRAAQGVDADAILKFYFPRLTVAPFREAAVRSSTTPARSAVRDDVVITISGEQARDRALITQVVRTARDRVSQRTRLKAPPELRVIVHPTVDAFMRATGEPWWMSGATEGHTIDLVPIAVLRQRGQLDLAIRREVAHVFVDSVLNGTPQWVREGAASFFAEPEPKKDSSGRSSCPSDEELRQPLSAGAYRAALARADACFRRAISRGVAWNQVR
jgi:SpoIID/LytB domain protein